MTDREAFEKWWHEDLMLPAYVKTEGLEKWQASGYKLIDTEAKLAIAIEALEYYSNIELCSSFRRSIAVEALNKIRGE